MSNNDKLASVLKFLKTTAPHLIETATYDVRFELKQHEGEWTVHNFKLEARP